MSQQSELADVVYERLRDGPLPTAALVQKLRQRWGVGQGVSEVHHFVCEVATCLLHREDVEVGNFEDGKFEAWLLEPWIADAKFEEQLMAMECFLEDEASFVFRKKSRTK